ncbi:MAG TPA: G/U mismatch-specific DNA glycosylase [Kofleriaceae bacterium]|nr:G/U mismatch-specific DNA glycosylase [Kofleriaceae bacterium]
MPTNHRPTRDQLADAILRKLRDVIAPGLRVLFCGINPGLYSTAAGHHFARPGNRFWPALHASGFTPRLFHPSQDRDLLDLGLGITNVVARTTASADELTKAELQHGATLLRRKILRFQPAFLAIVGLGAYRTAFQQPTASIGLQPASIGTARLWLLPNPSGLNAHHRPSDLARLFGDLRAAVDLAGPPRPTARSRAT